MKKTLKMTLVFGLLIAMLAGMTVSAAGTEANGGPTAQIIISNDNTTTGVDLTGKQFVVYKVFDADVDNKGLDSVINYVTNPDFENFFIGVGCTDENGEFDDAAAEAYIHDAANNSNMSKLVADMKAYIVKNSVDSATIISGNVTVGSHGQTLTSEELEPGYYVIFDESATGSAISAGMLVSLPEKNTKGEFLNDAIIAIKGSQPKIDKDIWHNDTSKWDTVGDYELGETVKFKITATLPSDVTSYDSYDYIITDTMSKGIEFKQGSIKIYLDEALEQEAEGRLHDETIYVDDPDGKIFTLDFNMLAIKDKFPSMKEFYIVYEGIVTDEAKVALDKENNKVELDYSNDPYDSESKGHDEDTVYSYTFAMDVFKTDTSQSNPLAGAKFALFAIPIEESGSEYQVYLEKDAETNTYYVKQSGTPDEASGAGFIVTDDTGLFTIKGLDDVKSYVLKEVEAPNGYTKADDLTFQITANYGDGIVPTVTTNCSQITVTDGVLSTKIINTSSELFPGTGGMGTPIFLIMGSVIMILSLGIFAVRRRRAY